MAFSRKEKQQGADDRGQGFAPRSGGAQPGWQPTETSSPSLGASLERKWEDAWRRARAANRTD